MRTFSEVLREIVNESDLSIYGMAKLWNVIGQC